jgi:hypothetical protein
MLCQCINFFFSVTQNLVFICNSKLPSPQIDKSEGAQNGPLSVLEVSDPKLCILAHLMSPLEPIDPLLESPLSHPILKQKAVACELINEVSSGIYL